MTNELDMEMMAWCIYTLLLMWVAFIVTFLPKLSDTEDDDDDGTI